MRVVVRALLRARGGRAGLLTLTILPTIMAAASSGGCRGQPVAHEAASEGEREPDGDPGVPVHAYFAALERRDCPGLQASLAGDAGLELAEQGCERVFAGFAEHPARLLGIESITPDGRDPSLRLVRARVRVGEREQQVIVGVQAVDGSWRVVRI